MGQENAGACELRERLSLWVLRNMGIATWHTRGQTNHQLELMRFLWGLTSDGGNRGGGGLA